MKKIAQKVEQKNAAIHTLRVSKWRGVWKYRIKQSGRAYKHAASEIIPRMITFKITRATTAWLSPIIFVSV